jgi:hypothetical protein
VGAHSVATAVSCSYASSYQLSFNLRSAFSAYFAQSTGLPDDIASLGTLGQVLLKLRISLIGQQLLHLHLIRTHVWITLISQHIPLIVLRFSER